MKTYNYTFNLISYARTGQRTIVANNYSEAVEQIQDIVKKSAQYYDFSFQSTDDPIISGACILDKLNI